MISMNITFKKFVTLNCQENESIIEKDHGVSEQVDLKVEALTTQQPAE